MQVCQNSKWLGLGLVTLIGASAAAAEPPTTQALLDKINALQDEVNKLKAQVAQPHDAADPAATGRSVQLDAARHDNLLDVQSFTSGYDPNRGFVIQSEDRRFLLHPWLLLQVRNETTFREDAKSGGRSDVENGFEIRRLKFGIDGNVVTPDLTYQMIFSVDRHNGNVLLEDAWARYNLPNTPFYVRGGQIRNPFDHEQIVYGPFLQTAERSLVDSLFANGEGIVQGASIGYDPNRALRAELAFTDGLRSSNTTFQDFPTTGIASDWGMAGRVELKLAGDWKQYTDFTAWNDTQPLLVLGAGADYTEAGDTAQFSHVADVQAEYPCGLSLYAAYLGRSVRHNAGAIGTNGGSATSAATFNTYDATARVQAGYVFAERLEPFIRYEYLNFDGHEIPAGTSHKPVHEITVGANYYLSGHRAKLTVDCSYLPSGCPVSDDGSGVLANPGHNEVVGRAQFQLLL